eukprot:2455657-Alexandrium_andersonii.AAC.1
MTEDVRQLVAEPSSRALLMDNRASEDAKLVGGGDKWSSAQNSAGSNSRTYCADGRCCSQRPARSQRAAH